MRTRHAPLLDFDRGHLWHPYSSMTRPGPAYLVESASGTRLRLRVDGEPREVVDAMASWWCAIHGYAVPELDAAARAQLDLMSHVMFGGLTHSPAVELGRRLVAALRDGLAPAAGLAAVREVRALGAVGVVELDRPADVPAVTRSALDAGVWVRPFGNLVYTMPPYVCTAEDLATITAGIVSAVKQVHG